LLLHILAHALAKSVAFLSAGEISLMEHTTAIGDVHGLTTRRPLIGGTFGLALLALIGFPPFGLFASELAIARAGFSEAMGWVTAAGFLLMLVVVVAVLSHARQMLLGGGTKDPGSSRTTAAAVPLVGGLFVLAVIGITIWPIQGLLDAAARVVAR
jgi:hydrogenase-4 component F